MRIVDADTIPVKEYTKWFNDPADVCAVKKMINRTPTLDAVCKDDYISIISAIIEKYNDIYEAYKYKCQKENNNYLSFCDFAGAINILNYVKEEMCKSKEDEEIDKDGK